MVDKEAEQGTQHREIGVPSPCRADAFHQVVPLVQGDDELALSVEDQTLVMGSGGRACKVRRKPQRSGPVTVAEPPSSTRLGYASPRSPNAGRYVALDSHSFTAFGCGNGTGDSSGKTVRVVHVHHMASIGHDDDIDAIPWPTRFGETG